MPALPDLVQIGQLVAATHGWAAAKAFKAYAWSEDDRGRIAACAADILKMFPKAAGSEHPLSATLAFQLQRQIQAPIYLVAGALSVEGAMVRSDRLPQDGSSPFAPDAPAWRGHIWLMVGPHIIDSAIFRLATAPDSPPELARHVHLLFGPDKGLYADHWRHARRIGLHYTPQYVLSDDDMTPLLAAAYQLMADGAR